MIQDVRYVSTARDEGNDAHLAAADWAQQRKHLVDAGDQHRPQVVRRSLGRLGRLGKRGATSPAGAEPEAERPVLSGLVCAVVFFACTACAIAVIAARSGEFGTSTPK